MASVELIQDKIPQYIFNRHTTYENTVLQEHSAIVSGLRDTASNEANLESQGRLFIGLCMKGASIKFIDDNFDKYFKNEFDKLPPNFTDREKRATAFTRTWLRLINEAMDHFLNKYKVDGSKAKIAIIDDVLPDGRRIIDAEDVPNVEFTDDEQGI